MVLWVRMEGQMNRKCYAHDRSNCATCGVGTYDPNRQTVPANTYPVPETYRIDNLGHILLDVMLDNPDIQKAMHYHSVMQVSIMPREVVGNVGRELRTFLQYSDVEHVFVGNQEDYTAGGITEWVKPDDKGGMFFLRENTPAYDLYWTTANKFCDAVLAAAIKNNTSINEWGEYDSND